ncbi:Serine carboxypeptidase-like 2 [Vitis vinifera]|uniref:Serine carboxypeptidase-like 2 n=1 Tax=Vitis vinifera TaxID=29760 RepID=A0A438KMG0_VITVI|nr:Serine carboxypeptidase-like 2 [Vitis vinifera]
MAMLCSIFRQFLFINLVLQVSSVVAASHSPVKFLPGFEGPLPFELETGYVGVGESEEVQLFYYFVKSENNPPEDPLLLWLTGGPGCSAFSALFYEIVPNHVLKLYVMREDRESTVFRVSTVPWELAHVGTEPTLVTQVSNIIFLDAPVGTGFSYATTSRASHSGDFQATHQAHEFLRKWLIDHPEFLSNPVYVGETPTLGLPSLSWFNTSQMGYLLGNPVTEKGTETTAQFRFAHGMALISDELYESLKTSCGDEYPFKYPINIQCIKDVQAFYKCISGIQIGQILEPVCGFGSLKPEDIFLSGRRYLIGKLRERRPEPSLSAFECRTDGYILAPYWANNATVQEALHIRKNTIREWQRCAMGLSYTPEIESSFEYHVTLSKKGYRSLIYSGDHDMIVAFFSTQAWIRSLNYSIVDDWRSWMVEGQVGGYTRTYSNQMTFATVKVKRNSSLHFRGGHTAPEYRPKSVLVCIKDGYLDSLCNQLPHLRAQIMTLSRNIPI